MGHYIDQLRYRKKGYGISRKLSKKIAIELIERVKQNDFEITCDKCDKGLIYKISENGNKYAETCECAIEKESLKYSKKLLEKANLKNTLKRYSMRIWQEAKECSYNKLLQIVDDNVEIPSWIFFWGSVGTGKTYSAIMLALLCILREKKVLFIPVAELMSFLRPEYKNNASNIPVRLMEKCKKIDVFILDDIGKEKVSDWVKERLHIIIDARYRNGLMTVFTSNYNIEKLKDSLSEALYSRIKGESIEIALESKIDKRLE